MIGQADDRPGCAGPRPDGRVEHLGHVAVGSGDPTGTFLDREILAQRADLGHLHLERRLRKPLEERGEQFGHFVSAGEHVSRLVDQFALGVEHGRQGLGVGGIEGLHGGGRRLPNRGEKLRLVASRRCWRLGHRRWLVGQKEPAIRAAGQPELSGQHARGNRSRCRCAG